ncbi:hypothetical protein SIIN_5397_T [Serendipita indica DSM 11827]|nr:hypothetical protein SIIN_5397_T [Serendipita indica DSM 11827]
MVRPIELEAIANDGLSFTQIAYNLRLIRWMNAVAVALVIYDTLLIIDRALVAKLVKYSQAVLLPRPGIMHNFDDDECSAIYHNEHNVWQLVDVSIATFISFPMCNWLLLERTRTLVERERPILDAVLVAYFSFRTPLLASSL